MRIVERQGWPRKDHFELYNSFDYPHVNICVQLDVTELWDHRRRLGASPTVALTYAITRAVQRVPELRHRLRGDQVVEHEVVHPSITVLGKDDLFGIVNLAYDADFAVFAAGADKDLARAKETASLSEFPYDRDGAPPRDDLISITVLPWLSFTSFAITRRAQESVPLLAFGRVQQVGERSQLPFSVNFHHALADGLHVARYVKYVEEEGRALAASAA